MHSTGIECLGMSFSCLYATNPLFVLLLLQWMPQDVLPAPITCAAYSPNSQLVYAAFTDGNIGVFDADSLKLRCRIAISVYLAQASPSRYFEQLYMVYEVAFSLNPIVF